MQQESLGRLWGEVQLAFQLFRVVGGAIKGAPIDFKSGDTPLSLICGNNVIGRAGRFLNVNFFEWNPPGCEELFGAPAIRAPSGGVNSDDLIHCLDFFASSGSRLVLFQPWLLLLEEIHG